MVECLEIKARAHNQETSGESLKVCMQMILKIQKEMFLSVFMRTISVTCRYSPGKETS